MPKVKTGIDRLFEEEIVDFKNKRVALLVHPASVNSRLQYTLDLFYENPKINLTRLFAPEHGLWGYAQDMIAVESQTDPRTSLPVKSLYGKNIASLKPTPADLADVDCVVCDLQDIGSRYYTFIYTMALTMQACAENNREMIVLDRPNPINGIDLEGKILKKGFESFVGLYPLPVRHGMTIGELAAYFNEECNIECNLKVVPMKGWKREMFFDATSLPWVPPSPNMPTLETALVYPGMCLLEATNLSEGRGTTRPFELAGAPFIDAHELAKNLSALHLEGVIFRPTTFRPTFHKWANEECGGVQLHVTDRKKFRPYLTGVAFLKTVIDLYPNDFQWRDKPYEFVSEIPAIDLLSGDAVLRKKLEAHASLEDIQKDWKEGYEEFLKKRQKHLLY
ncbi:MAG: DUF1343 domain-containing protein [Deltaproteobacteria bacterium]|nr:DUF1343 domain-containing protein [Deltaproteobacteria bacterium]